MTIAPEFAHAFAGVELEFVDLSGPGRRDVDFDNEIGRRIGGGIFARHEVKAVVRLSAAFHRDQ